ncbi:MFS transporter [Streptomyces sp. NPDC057580]|uniref:MFS transporter n=1 Tax=Streptomyces sp. NPDC057580 TaxID=3346173 RepID=UPI0036C30A49
MSLTPTARYAARTNSPVRRSPAYAAHRRRRGPGPTASLALLASIVVSLLAASSAPTPLYAIYQQRWGFSPITTTTVFGVYALAVLVSLLVLGKISDHVGRRPVLLAALTGQAAAMVVFATAGGVDALLAARVVQGVGTGAALGAIGAGMLDIDPRRGGFLNSLAPAVGTAGGALVSGLIVQYLPVPTRLVYFVLLGIFVLQALGVLALRETVSRKPGALAGMVPEIKLPKAVRTPVAIAAPVLFAVWALAGFYGALGPAIIRTLVHSTSVVWGGLPLFVLAGSAGLAVLVLRGTSTRTVMLLGAGALIAGVAITLVSIGPGTGGPAAATGFFAGSAIAGFGFGSGFQGGIRMVMPQTEPHERAGVLSLLYVVSYLGLGVPAVIGGVLVVHGGGLLQTAREYGIAVIVLTAAALAGLMLSGRRAEPVAALRTAAGSTPEAAPAPQTARVPQTISG